MLDADENSKRSDHYRRAGLARRLSDVLLSPFGLDSLVVAIDGPWGSGKSWLLEQVQKKLDDGNVGTSSAKVVRFNPWLIGEESDLISDFLVQVAMDLSLGKTVQKEAKDASKKLLKYVRILSYGRYLKYAPIPVIDKVGEVIDNAATAYEDKIEKLEEALDGDDRPSISDARAAAIQAVRNLGKRLVILIDDIDRLRPREIRAVMQLVKATADFPNTSFLLAYDGQEVAKVISNDKDPEGGRRYLEKITQLTVAVPPLDDDLIRRDFDARFASAVNWSGHALKTYESELLGEVRALVAAMTTTPRDVVRWANHFAWALSALGGSVNAADLCVAEAFRLKASPQLWKKVIDAQVIKSGGMGDADLPNWMEWAEIQEPIDKAALADISKEFGSQEMFAAATFLFPSLKSSEKNHATNLQEHRRLSFPLIWQHYQNFGTGKTSITGSMVEGWLQMPEDFDEALGNSDIDVSNDKLQLLQEVSGFISFDQLPQDFEKIKPLVRSVQRVASSSLIEKSFVSWNLANLMEELLLAQALADTDTDLVELTRTFPLPELARAIENMVDNRNVSGSSTQRGQAAASVLPICKREAASRIKIAIEDRSLLKERGRIYLLGVLSKLLPAEPVSQHLSTLTQLNEDLLQFLGEMENLQDQEIQGRSFIKLFERPRELIRRLQSINDLRFSGLVASLSKVSDEDLDRIEQMHTLSNELMNHG